jgi:2-polyprenyl-3-methyl-5-hydroxy-6-metoxy-1,4-benzoquinol methylase
MIENEGVRVREARCCLLCEGEGVTLYSGLRDRLFGAPGVWSLMQCPNCELVWLNPRPIPEDIGKLYSQYYTHQVLEAPKKMLAGLRESVKASVLQSSFGYHIEGSSRMLGSMLSKIGPIKDIVGSKVCYLKTCEKGRLLDVGCGNGLFLDYMRQLGWDVVGVEPDDEAVIVAREMLGLQVFKGSLEEAKFSDGHFDAITLSHVIEHVPDPIGLLKECRRVLRLGGKLVVVTPNIRSLGAHVFGEYWRGLEVPRHLFLFSPEALRTLAERAGLVIQDLRTTARTARWSWAVSSFIRRNGTHPGSLPEASGPSLRLQGLAFQAIEYGLSGRKGAGEELVMIAVKQENEDGISN